MKTRIQETRLCPNGVVGEKITLSLKLSDWLLEQSMDEKIITDRKMNRIEETMMEALNRIEKLLQITSKEK